MPIEIRELIIKTEISAIHRNDAQEIGIRELENLKMQLLEECKRIISTQTQKNSYKR